MPEPSVLLVDDMPTHEIYLRMVPLDGWTIDAAIDKEIQGAVDRAVAKLEKSGGCTIMLLDITWPTDDLGGIRVYHGISQRFGSAPPLRRVIPFSRASMRRRPELIRFLEVLRVPREDQSLQLTTETERQRMGKAFQKIWREELRQDRRG